LSTIVKRELYKNCSNTSASMKFFRIIICIVTLCLGYGVQAQLVNIESKRMQTDSIRFVLSSDLLFNYTDNNGEYILQIGSNLSTQFKSKDLQKTFFFIGNLNLIRSKDQDFQNAWFLHGRYNQKVSRIVRLEAFIQNQNNKKLTIKRRNLVGAGLRLKLVTSELTNVYFGNSYMYEIEEMDTPAQKFYNHRNSSYLSINQAFDKIDLTITGTFYFQPLYRAINNHRILSQFKAELPLTKRISFSALYNYSVIKFSSDLADDRFSNIRLGLTFSI